MKTLLLLIAFCLIALPLFGGSSRLLSRPGETTQDVTKVGSQDKKTTAGEGREIELNTTLITTPVLVSDRNNRYVTGLDQKDFKIYEDGIDQKISFFGSSKEPFSAVLMLNTSDSAKRYLKDEQDAAISFIKLIGLEDRVALTTFSSEVTSPLAKWTNDQTALTNAIRGISAGGHTNLVSALDTVIRAFGDTKGRKALIVFSDGGDKRSDKGAKELLSKVEELGALVYVIEYPSEARRTTYTKDSGGADYNPDASRGVIAVSTTVVPSWNSVLLHSLADSSGGRQIAGPLGDTTNGSGQQTIQAIIEEIRHQYVLGYYPTSQQKAGKYRKIKVKVERPDVSVRSRKGYTSR